MAEVLTIGLMGLRNALADESSDVWYSLEFLRAEMSAKYDIPFALIRYALDGKEQESGLRLDLDKQVFLDHFENAEMEEAAQKAAPLIVEFLGEKLYSK
jgi:hypothetical protein